MNEKFYIIIIFAIALSAKSNAQLQDTTTLAKGRYITTLYGNFRSQLSDVNTGGSTERVRTTGYEIGTKSGFFIGDAWAFGLDFSLSKEEYSNINLKASSEELIAGLWTRWYFVQAGKGALFADLTAFYTAVNNPLIINTPSLLFHEELDGAGFGIEPGIGFAYVINRNVGFGMSVSYRGAKIAADRKDVLQNISVSETYTTGQLQFSFNFQVYLDQFFF